VSPHAKPLRYLALAGPTASGKTAAALAIALELPVEIISVDSALVYRGMDIGTAKPTLAERQAVVHHLIDIRDPAQSYSAADFARDATALIADIRGRGKLPLLVGGTMLYFKALFDGLDTLPASDASVRAALDAQCQALGIQALHAQLAKVDPATAQRLPPTDTQRILRALEVFQLSGQPLSALHTLKQGRSHAALPLLSLEPHERGWLHQRIHQRFDGMLAQGFLDEVRTLRRRPGLHADLPSMRCVGYRQAWEALDAGQEQDGAWVERAIAATRQLAKRQITWLRASPERRAIPCEAPDALAQVLALARAFARNGDDGCS